MKDSIQILIADDEQLAREKIISFLKDFETPYTVLEASNGKEAIHELLSEEIDLVFLDIKMTDMSGFDVLSNIPKKKIPIIIFVTAFNNFAVKAFEVNAVDFLLKPYKKTRFLESLKRAESLLALKEQRSFQNKMARLMDYFDTHENAWDERPQSFLDKITIKSNKRYQFIEVAHLKYILASGYYAELYSLNGDKHVYRTSMTQLAEKLDPQKFSRINRSTIINILEIREIISEGFGDYSVKMKDRESFTISKGYKASFLQIVGIK